MMIMIINIIIVIIIIIILVVIIIIVIIKMVRATKAMRTEAGEEVNSLIAIIIANANVNAIANDINLAKVNLTAIAIDNVFHCHYHFYSQFVLPLWLRL